MRASVDCAGVRVRDWDGGAWIARSGCGVEQRRLYRVYSAAERWFLEGCMTSANYIELHARSRLAFGRRVAAGGFDCAPAELKSPAMALLIATVFRDGAVSQAGAEIGCGDYRAEWWGGGFRYALLAESRLVIRTCASADKSKCARAWDQESVLRG